MALTNNKVQHVRSSVASAVPTAIQLLDGQIALNTVDEKVFIKNSSGVVVEIASSAAVTAAGSAVQSVNGQTPTAGAVTVTPAQIGTFGVAPLDTDGKILLANIPDSLIGAVDYQGTWDASTNTPTLPDPTTSKGFYYVVSTAGTQFGNDYLVGDWAISDGTAWEKIQSQSPVQSVNGKVGTVVLAASDVNALDLTLGGSVTGAVTFAGETIVPAPTNAGDATNKGYVDTAIAAIPAAPVDSVNGQTGTVVLAASDVGALPIAGGDITGDLIVNGAIVADGTFTANGTAVVQTATSDSEAVNLGQVNSLIAAIPAAPVTSVNGKTGVVELSASDVNALDVTDGGVVAGATTFTSELTVATAVAGTSAVNLTQVNTLIGESGGGTVTSVDVSVPSILTSTGGPVTTTGTIALALATQAAVSVFAGPASGADATPTFRALAATDIPALDEGTYA